MEIVNVALNSQKYHYMVHDETCESFCACVIIKMVIIFRVQKNATKMHLNTTGTGRIDLNSISIPFFRNFGISN